MIHVTMAISGPGLGDGAVAEVLSLLYDRSSLPGCHAGTQRVLLWGEHQDEVRDSKRQ